ncbi:MAG: signal peptidase I [Actinomycetota bacterium]
MTDPDATNADPDAVDADPQPQADRKRQRPFWMELPVLIVLAFALALFLKQFLVQAFYIPSESMLPTLQVDDRLMVDKLVYRVRDPRRGEIIVFIAEHGEEQSFAQRVKSVFLEGFGVQRPGDVDFVKRIIGLPGETVELVDGTVFITPPGRERFALDEPYVSFTDQADHGPIVVPEDSYFVLGDNRPASADSRVRGPIPRSDIVGRARLRIWPLGRLSGFPTPDYGAPSG